MRKKNFHIRVEVMLLLLATPLFCYFRLKPIHLQSAPYTHDEGRDFIQAAQLAIGQNLTKMSVMTLSFVLASIAIIALCSVPIMAKKMRTRWISYHSSIKIIFFGIIIFTDFPIYIS